MINRVPAGAPSPRVPDPSATDRVTARTFVDLAQAVAAAARECGVDPPGFQTLPPLGRHGRVLRRSKAGAVVAIRTVDKSEWEVRNDMIEGVVRLQNPADPVEEATLRAQLQSELAGPSARNRSSVSGGPRPIAA